MIKYTSVWLNVIKYEVWIVMSPWRVPWMGDIDVGVGDIDVGGERKADVAVDVTRNGWHCCTWSKIENDYELNTIK